MCVLLLPSCNPNSPSGSKLTPPQMIPLPPYTLASMWRILSQYTFSAVHGGFPGLDIEAEDVKKRVWESMGIQVGAEGWQGGEGFVEEFRLVAPM